MLLILQHFECRTCSVVFFPWSTSSVSSVCSSVCTFSSLTTHLNWRNPSLPILCPPPSPPPLCLCLYPLRIRHSHYLCLTTWISQHSTSISLPSSLQDELQELYGLPGLAVLPVPPHHRHLCPGALGKVHLQLHPLLRHRHGDLHLICLCAHPCAPRTGVFLWDLWRPAWEHHGTHELKEGENMGGKKQRLGGLA